MKHSICLALLVASLCGCASFPSTFSKGPRTITLGDKTYSEGTSGEFVSWVCRDYVEGGKILVEVGSFSTPTLNGFGFVIYDGGDSGEVTQYQRKGINLRWDWGPNGNDFAFVIKPDGTGLFYDFSNAKSESIKANQVFKCTQR
jgi:hypothetical protein